MRSLTALVSDVSGAVTFLVASDTSCPAAIALNFMKEIARTGPELYFSQSVLLMYGTNCLNLLTLVRYRCSCEMCMARICLAICIYNFIVLLICWATFSALCLVVLSFDNVM